MILKYLLNYETRSDYNTGHITFILWLSHLINLFIIRNRKILRRHSAYERSQWYYGSKPPHEWH